MAQAARLGLALSLLACVSVAGDFTLDGQMVRLRPAPAGMEVGFQTMRFNRAANVWNVEVVLRNQSSEALTGPFVLSLQTASGTSQPLQPDGFDDGEPALPFFDLSAQVPGGALSPGGQSEPRTLALSFGEQAPRLTPRVFVGPATKLYSVALTRSLNEAGQPLPGVQIDETGPAGAVARRTDSAFGLASLGQRAGEHTWKFSAPGYLPVWRRQTLVKEQVAIVANPRLTQRSLSAALLTPAAGGSVADRSGTIRIRFGPGAFGQDTAATLTPLTAQTLPALLPLGWSPLQAFWLELANEPAIAGLGELTPWGPVGATEQAVLARWDDQRIEWEVLAPVNGGGNSAISASLPGSGAYVLALGDTAPAAPPPPVVGQALLPSAAELPDLAALTAGGQVAPAVSQASRAAELVTATATAAITNQAGPLPSGVTFRVEVRERYALSDGTRRFPPEYESFITGYQRPGGSVAVLAASFPMRPLLLLGPEELVEATVAVDVLRPTSFGGGLFDAEGGELNFDGIRVSASPGDFAGPQAAQLRLLDQEHFVELAGAGASVVRAFQLSVPDLRPDCRLAVRFDGLAPNRQFVLAAVLAENGVYGLLPVERLASDANGRAVSAEPAIGERLPGVTMAGQYLLLEVGAAQGLVRGVVRGRQAQPAAGVAVNVAGQPWLVFSAADGRYRLLAPAGEASIETRDLANGDTGQMAVTLADLEAGATADVDCGPAGPRVASVSPANGARGVARVSPVVITFNKPINPGTLGVNGLQLVGTNGQAVAASLTLNLRNTVATLLPTAQLAPLSVYAVRLSAGIADADARPLEGAREFAFTTASDVLARVGAQLTTYEPTNGLARMTGSPGTADPESPVILMNETTGRTATVLSKPDGSFDNFLEADTEDLLSAVLVNQNGTRTLVPVSRQLFRDGSVALFNGGGILEAQTDGGPVQVLVEPGAIAGKTKFKLEPLSIQRILSLMSNAPPIGGLAVLGGFSCKLSGDTPKSEVDVRIPVDPAMLNLPPGANPEDGGYALTRLRTIDGVKVYEVVDNLEYKDGYLETHSPPFGGAFGGTDESFTTAAIQMSFAGKVLITGQAVSKGVLPTSPNRPVPGATVFIVPAEQSTQQEQGRLNAGAIVAVANRAGSFVLLAPTIENATAYALLATSPLFPGHYGVGSAELENIGGDSPVAKGAVVFSRTGAGAVVQDAIRPQVSIAHLPQLPVVNQIVEVQVLATDNADSPNVQMWVTGVVPASSSNSLTTADVTLTPLPPQPMAPVTRAKFHLKATKPGQVRLSVLAVDTSANARTVPYTLTVYEEAPPVPYTGAQGQDIVGPRVLQTYPRPDWTEVDPYDAIRVTFSEPIDATITNAPDQAIQIDPPAGTPFAQLSPDGRELALYYPAMQGGQDYTLTVNSNVKDLSGNGLDQQPEDMTSLAQCYTMGFTTRSTYLQTLTDVVNGAGVASSANGQWLFALDRDGIAQDRGWLRVFSRLSNGQCAKVADYELEAYPRDLLLISQYAYKDAQWVKHTNDLLVVVGGLVGGSGQWLRVLNVDAPTSPKVVATCHISKSPMASVVKLLWSAPVIGYLEYETETASVGLINLQLLIYAQNLTSMAAEPELGHPGLDINADGDYVDPDEKIPRPLRKRPISGVLNGGLVGQYVLPVTPQGDEAVERITDFTIALGGRFVAVTHGPGRDASEPPGYRTLAVNGVPLDRPAGFLEFPRQPDRISAFIGVSMWRTGSLETLNVALISGGKPNVLSCVDVTVPEQPELLADITIPADQGPPYATALTDSGAVLLQTQQGLVVLRSDLLAWQASGQSHPAVLGYIPGTGGGARSFFGSGTRDFASSHGSRTVVATKTPPTQFTTDAIRLLDPNPSGTRQSSAFHLEIVSSEPGTGPNAGPPGDLVTCEATFEPAGVTVPPGYPQWTINGPDLAAAANGASVQFGVPQYTVPNVPLLVGLIPPRRYHVGCGTRSLALYVYPSYSQSTLISLETFQTWRDAIENAQDLLRQLGQTMPGFHTDAKFTPPEGSLGFTNQWEECPTSHLARLTFTVDAAFDPLVGFQGSAGFGWTVPDGIPYFAGKGVDIALEAFGKLALRGVIRRDSSGEWHFSYATTPQGGPPAGILVSGEMGLKGTAMLDVVFLALKFETEAKISAGGQLEVDPNNLHPILKDFKADFEGVSAKLTCEAWGNQVVPEQTFVFMQGYNLIPQLDVDLLP